VHSTTEAQQSIFEAEGLGALERAMGSAKALAHHLEEAANAFRHVAGPIESDCHRVAELHRLATHRLAVLVRAVGGGDRADG
jgi:hypothetical protein